MNGRTERLLAACAAGDETAIAQLGWQPILDRLRAWPRPVTADMLRTYVVSLGDDDPDVVTAALRALRANPYRPSPSEIVQAIAAATPAPARGLERPTRDELRQRARTAVILAYEAGEQPCECRPRPVTWQVDRDGVLRHRDVIDEDRIVREQGCDGLEVGLLEDALEAREASAD